MYFSFAVKFLQVALQFSVQFLLVHLVSKSTYGSYSFVVAVIGIVSIITQLGLPELTMREVARAVAQKAGWSARRILRLSSSFFAINVAVMFAIAIAIRNYVPESLAVLALVWPQVVTILVAGGILRIIAGYYRGLGFYIVGLSAESLMFPVLFLLVVVVSAATASDLDQNGVSSLVNTHAFAIGVLAIGMAVTVLIWPQTMPGSISCIEAPNLKTQFVSAVVIGTQTGVHILFTYVDIIMLTILVELSDVAEYRLATQVAQLAVLANLALTAYFAPRIAAAYHSGHHAEIRRIVRLSKVWASGYACAVGALLAVAGPWTVPFLFGSDYAPVYALSLILVAGHATNVSFGPLGVLLNMTGHQNYTLVASILSLATNIVLNYLLIRVWGVQGAAIATAISLVISKSATMVFVRRLGILL